MRFLSDLMIRIWMVIRGHDDPSTRFVVIARYQLTELGREVLREE